MKNRIVILLIFLVFNLNSNSQNTNKILIVEGKSKISTQPELAIFRINFESTNLEYEKCIENALNKIKETKLLLSKNGIKENELKTFSFSVSKNFKYNPQSKENIFIAYKASIPLVLKMSINDSKIDRVFEIVNKKFKTNYSINFELSGSQIDSLRNEVIKLAIIDAKAKTKAICKETNIKTIEIHKIQYGDPMVLSNFAQPTYELLNKGVGYRVLLRGTRSINSIRNVLSPPDIELKTNIVIAWIIEN